MNKRTVKILRTALIIIVLSWFGLELLQKYVLLGYFGEKTEGAIEKIWVSRVAQPHVRYSYTIDGRQYVRDMMIDEELPCESELMKCEGKLLPVEYLPWNPGISRLVILDGS